jgi:hypothetical protein
MEQSSWRTDIPAEDVPVVASGVVSDDGREQRRRSPA